jgi:hypothetical protein
VINTAVRIPMLGTRFSAQSLHSKMAAVCHSETSVNLCHNVQCYIADDIILHCNELSTFKVSIVWDIAMCSLNKNQRMERKYYLNFQGRKSAEQEIGMVAPDT